MTERLIFHVYRMICNSCVIIIPTVLHQEAAGFTNSVGCGLSPLALPTGCNTKQCGVKFLFLYPCVKLSLTSTKDPRRERTYIFLISNLILLLNYLLNNLK